MRRGRLRSQPRGVRGHPPLEQEPRAPQRPPLLSVLLHTERLRLRPVGRKDLEALARWNADPRFMTHMGRPPMTREESAESLARYEAHWREHGFGLLGAEDRTTGELIGRSGVAYHRIWRGDPEVGWGFDPAWWGRGLATEAGRASVEWAFGELGLDRLVSITTEENLASRRVMAKLGFRLLEQRRDPRSGLLLWIHGLDRGDARRAAL